MALQRKSKLRKKKISFGSPEHERMLNHLFWCVDNNKTDKFEYKDYPFESSDLIMVMNRYRDDEEYDLKMSKMLECFFK